MSKLILFWHRRDLRINDHIGLANATEQTTKIVGVFCFDPNILNRDDIAPATVTYMIGCLELLQQSYVAAGSQLLILSGDPVEKIPALANRLNAHAVYWSEDVEPFAKKRDRNVANLLEKSSIEYQTFWDQILHSPAEIFSGNNQPYTVYTPFWKNWITKPKLTPAPASFQWTGLTANELDLAQEIGILQTIPTAKSLGYHWPYPLLIKPGEIESQKLLDNFVKKAIYNYSEERNFPGDNGTAKLSPALRFGAIGIRTIWQKTIDAINKTRSEINHKNVQVWRQELAWREFYQHALYHFPQLADGPYRPLFQDFPWENNEKNFQAWCEGKTGYPIVDAAMRELNQTGWMHNRCRMIVASFLTKDLIINWQWGEKYFMQKLIDGELAANNGGWQWSASSGMDPRPLRIFNPASQAERFDAEAKYIRQWLPELTKVETRDLISGKIGAIERQLYGYPEPIVDHNYQQRKFKELYQQQKLIKQE